ncbi:KxDL motif-containing protein [Trichinella pseudospiralis]
MRRKFVVALSGADLRSAVDDGERQLEHRPDRCLTVSLNRTCLGSSGRSEESCNDILSPTVSCHSMIASAFLDMSMRSLCLLDLNLPEYGDGPVNWERGKLLCCHCADNVSSPVDTTLSACFVPRIAW